MKLFAVWMIFFGLSFCPLSGSGQPAPPFGKNNAALSQFDWGSANYAAGIAAGDPLVAVWSTWLDYQRARSLGWSDPGGIDLILASERIEEIISHWELRQTNKLVYKYKYQELEAGWWSSMDMLLMPLLLIAAGQDANNEEWLALARRMLAVAIKSPVDGGSLWPDVGHGCWFSEYSWRGMSKEAEYYVLNGHLFSLTALGLAAEALNDEELKAAFKCGLRGTKALTEKFVGWSGWPLYQLTPPTVNMPHYVIFEAMQFQDLYLITGDKYFLSQANLRRSVLERQYPVYRVSSGGEGFLFFSGVGAPHPYEPDIFYSEINCRGNGGVSLEKLDSTYLPKGRFYRSKKMPTKVKECDVWAVRDGNLKTKIFTTNNILDVAARQPKRLDFTLEASLDAFKQSDVVVVDPSLKVSGDGPPSYLDVEGRLVLRFASQVLKPRTLLAVEVESSANLDLELMYWDGEQSVRRNYRPLKKSQRNLIVVSHLGFDNAGAQVRVDALGLAVLTHALTDIAHLKVKGLYLVENQFELHELLRKSRGEINWAFDGWVPPVIKDEGEK